MAVCMISSYAHAGIDLGGVVKVVIGKDKEEAKAAVEKKYYCILKDNFDKSFDGEGDSELKAKATAQKNCENAHHGSGMFCKNAAECSSSG